MTTHPEKLRNVDARDKREAMIFRGDLCFETHATSNFTCDRLLIPTLQTAPMLLPPRQLAGAPSRVDGAGGAVKRKAATLDLARASRRRPGSFRVRRARARHARNSWAAIVFKAAHGSANRKGYDRA